jgi:hypothetical protein
MVINKDNQKRLVIQDIFKIVNGQGSDKQNVGVLVAGEDQ